MSIAYLDHAAATPAGQGYKRDLLAMLDLRPGQVVVDVGCGPGTDLAALATAVAGDAAGQHGVIGIDHDPAMVAEAARRYVGTPSIAVRAGDAHALPLADRSVDRLRIDRVLQHVSDPARALAEVRRVLRPDGRAVLADPDWDTLAIDDEDLDTSRAYTRYVATQVVRNAAIGRQLGRLAHGVGLRIRSHRPTVVAFADHLAAEAVLRTDDVARRAINDGFLGAAAALAWRRRLAMAPTFHASFTMHLMAVEPASPSTVTRLAA